jgi:hypothetical protein
MFKCNSDDNTTTLERLFFGVPFCARSLAAAASAVPASRASRAPHTAARARTAMAQNDDAPKGMFARLGFVRTIRGAAAQDATNLSRIRQPQIRVETKDRLATTRTDRESLVFARRRAEGKK